MATISLSLQNLAVTPSTVVSLAIIASLNVTVRRIASGVDSSVRITLKPILCKIHAAALASSPAPRITIFILSNTTDFKQKSGKMQGGLATICLWFEYYLVEDGNSPAGNECQYPPDVGNARVQMQRAVDFGSGIIFKAVAP